MAPKVVEIRNSIEEKVERVELSREAPAHVISGMYAAFAPMKLTGRIMEPPDGPQLLTLEACRDYADDFAYDEQQCRLRLSQRSWEEFDLSDAAFLLGYLHVVSLEIRYSAFHIWRRLSCVRKTGLWRLMLSSPGYGMISGIRK